MGECTLKCYLKRPDLYRVEVVDTHGERAGLLVCDGRSCWKTWPQGTTYFTQDSGRPEREYEIYMKERAFKGKSISHQFSLLPHVCMPVFNANLFFGGSESVMEYLDDIRYLGEEYAVDYKNGRLTALAPEIMEEGIEYFIRCGSCSIGNYIPSKSPQSVKSKARSERGSSRDHSNGHEGGSRRRPEGLLLRLTAEPGSSAPRGR